MKNLTHGSLFSGIGGFDLGAELSNIPTIWNCEINAECRKVLAKHFPNTQQFTDIQDLHNPPYVDIVSEFLKRLRPDIILERFSSESPKELLLAPNWGGLKNFAITDKIRKKMLDTQAYQGQFY